MTGSSSDSSGSSGSVVRTARTIHDFARRSASVQDATRSGRIDRFLILECYEAGVDQPAQFVVYNCEQDCCDVVDAGHFLYRAVFDREAPPPEELRAAYERLMNG